MTAESVSFRISRHTQDLAQTTHALSQRLVKLEQRLEALELEMLSLQDDRSSQQEPEPLDSLENVERLLNDCRALLGLEGSGSGESTEASRDVEAFLDEQPEVIAA